MAKWKPWQTYEEVPEAVLKYAYNDKKQIEQRSPEYLVHLNQVFNAQPMRERAEAPKGLPCITCDRNLTAAEAEARLCTSCQKKLNERGHIDVLAGWGVQLVKAREGVQAK